MFPQKIRFDNRTDAGKKLAARLREFAPARPLIVALPRGGVPIGFEVAWALDAQLDLLIVRKIGAPGYKEVGIGAVIDGSDPQVVLNEDLVRQINPGEDYIRQEIKSELAELERRRKAYCGKARPIPMRGRTVIVVDDGIATGGTMKAALRGARKNAPARLILAVPVAPRSALRDFEEECDEIICLATPEPFGAVGAYYRQFDQTSDAEVIALMDQARSRKISQSEPSP